MIAVNKTGINWCDYMFTLLTGSDLCPTIRLERLAFKAPSKPSRILIMGDPCGDWDWYVLPAGAYYCKSEMQEAEFVQEKLWQYIERYPEHHFIMLTKNPAGLKRRVTRGLPDFIGDGPNELVTCSYAPLPSNLIWGISITGNDAESVERLRVFNEVRFPDEKIIINYEPASPLPDLPEVAPGQGWLIIGAQTEPGEISPEHRWCESAIDNARLRGWKIWTKDSIIRLFGLCYDNENGAVWPCEQLSLPSKKQYHRCPECGDRILKSHYCCKNCELKLLQQEGPGGPDGPPQRGEDGWEAGCDWS